jgi:hypothetical protein
MATARATYQVRGPLTHTTQYHCSCIVHREVAERKIYMVALCHSLEKGKTCSFTDKEVQVGIQVYGINHSSLIQLGAWISLRAGWPGFDSR